VFSKSYVDLAKRSKLVAIRTSPTPSRATQAGAASGPRLCSARNLPEHLLVPRVPGLADLGIHTLTVGGEPGVAEHHGERTYRENSGVMFRHRVGGDGRKSD